MIKFIINEFLNNYTFRIVAYGCCLLGIVSGVIGCFAVVRKQSLLGDVISHASLPGICIGFLLFQSKNSEILLLGAFIIGLICIYLIQQIFQKSKIKFDSILAFLLSVFFGLGLVLLTYINKLPTANKSGLNRFLFGQASTFTQRDINLLIIVGTFILLITILFWKEFKLISFDYDYGKTIGYSSNLLDMLISLLIVIIIVIGIQVVGIILISAMIISPVIAARQWTNKLSIMAILSGIFGGISGLLGTTISISSNNLPTGPIIVIIINIIALISILFSYKRGIIFKVFNIYLQKKKIKRKINNKNEVKL